MKLVLPTVAVFLLIGLWFTLRTQQKHTQNRRTPDPAVYVGLRNLMLHSTREKGGIPPASKPTDPYGVLMDWGVDAGTATVVAMADGTASVYLSSGGGFLGGGQSHESIRAAAKKTVELAGEVQPIMQLTTMYPLPQRGRVTFYVLTDAGVFTATASDQEMATHKSPLYKLGDSAQTIITEYRLMQRGK